MNSLVEKLLKNTTIEQSDIFQNSEYYKKIDPTVTSIPGINVALSGNVEGGLLPGLLQIAGESKSFKTLFSLFLVSTHLRKHPDSALLFYDSEFGAPQSYFKSLKVPQDRVVHSPIPDIEILKHDIVTQLDNLGKKDKIIILIDSIGNLASRKEIDDALDGKVVADMTRAKALASLFRMVTPHLAMKKIPMIVVNHVYKDMGMFPKDIVSGGTKSYYSANDIWIVKRAQYKEGEDLAGYHFTINIEKSRFVKEKSKMPITVTQKGGINKWSGLFENALESKHLIKPKKGVYMVKGLDDEFSEKQIREDGNVWKMLLKDQEFVDFLKDKYTLSTEEMLENEEAEIEIKETVAKKKSGKSEKTDGSAPNQ
jgi:hypothetical protein